MLCGDNGENRVMILVDDTSSIQLFPPGEVVTRPEKAAAAVSGGAQEEEEHPDPNYTSLECFLRAVSRPLGTRTYVTGHVGQIPDTQSPDPR